MDITDRFENILMIMLPIMFIGLAFHCEMRQDQMIKDLIYKGVPIACAKAAIEDYPVSGDCRQFKLEVNE